MGFFVWLGFGFSLGWVFWVLWVFSVCFFGVFGGFCLIGWGCYFVGFCLGFFCLLFVWGVDWFWGFFVCFDCFGGVFGVCVLA